VSDICLKASGTAMISSPSFSHYLSSVRQEIDLGIPREEFGLLSLLIFYEFGI
jgi:hypothetical protein